MRPKVTYYRRPTRVGWLGWIDYPGKWVRFIGLDGSISKAYRAKD